MLKKLRVELRRPKLLVSVRDVAEAEAALAGGADWIDLKEPVGGAAGGSNCRDGASSRRVAWRVAGPFQPHWGNLPIGPPRRPDNCST